MQFEIGFALIFITTLNSYGKYQTKKLFTEFPPVPTGEMEEDRSRPERSRLRAEISGMERDSTSAPTRAENLEGIKFLACRRSSPYACGTRAHNRWHVHQTVTVECPKTANAEALPQTPNCGCRFAGLRDRRRASPPIWPCAARRHLRSPPFRWRSAARAWATSPNW